MTSTSRPATLSNLPSVMPAAPATRPSNSRLSEIAAPGGGSSAHAADGTSSVSPATAAAALLASDFHAPHVPEEYGGAGADALATVLVIEEVARACVSSSLIPAVNKLGSLPLILGGSDELKRKYLTPLALGRSGFSYGLSEREFNPSHPELNLQLPDGSRLFATAWVCGRPVLAIRRHRYMKVDLDDLVGLGTIDAGMALSGLSNFSATTVPVSIGNP